VRLLFSFLTGTGHVTPLLPIATAARAAGHEVAFAGPAATLPIVEAAGFRGFPAGVYRGGTPEEAAVGAAYRAQPTIAEAEALLQRLSFAGFRPRRKAADLAGVLAAWRPDAVVREETDFGAALAAELAGLPHATVHIIAAGSYFRPELIAEPLNERRAELGLPPDPTLAALDRYLVLSPFPPSFRDPAFPLPPTGHALRPIALDAVGGEGLPPWLDVLPDRPLVHFSLGTAFNSARPHLFGAVMDALADEPLNLIVTVGRDLDPASVGTAPANARVERYVPLSLLFPRCAPVITPGGSGTVMAALGAGVPLVVMPVGADHPQNGERCTALAVGRVVDAEPFDPRALREAVRGVLDGAAYRRNASRMAAEIAALPGPDHAVGLVERLAATRAPVRAAGDVAP
jgi:UDP:flavonoid glycosyltransferase YjiC (YdhE family)